MNIFFFVCLYGKMDAKLTNKPGIDKYDRL